MGQYDITLRQLTRIGGCLFLRTVGGEGRLTLLPTDLPSTKDRRVDFLAVLDAPDGSRKILHIEFQASADAKMPTRMLGYYCDILAWLDSRREALVGVLPRQIVQKVVYVGAAPWNPQTTIRHENLEFRFEFVDVRELDARPLLEGG